MNDFPPPKLGLRTFDKRYEFDVYPQPDTPPAIAGVYALLVRQVESGRGLVNVLYIGEAKDVSTVAAGHPVLPCLVENGFNAVAVWPETDAAGRAELVAALLQARNTWPSCQPGEPD